MTAEQVSETRLQMIHGERLHYRPFHLLSVGVCLFLTTVTLGDQPKVTITGGCDPSQHNYSWQVTNHYASPIIRIEFPHYAADLFSTPTSWTQGSRKEMGLVGEGWDAQRPGLCIAKAGSPQAGVPKDGNATFGMRIAAIGALRAEGTVHVVFADQSTFDVKGVVLPKKPVEYPPWLTVVALGAFFVLFVIVREVRRKRKGDASPPPSVSPPSDGGTVC